MVYLPFSLVPPRCFCTRAGPGGLAGPHHRLTGIARQGEGQHMGGVPPADDLHPLEVDLLCAALEEIRSQLISRS